MIDNNNIYFMDCFYFNVYIGISFLDIVFFMEKFNVSFGMVFELS